MKSLKGMLVVGEKNIFSELAQIVNIAAQANNIIITMVKTESDNQAQSENVQAIRVLEKKSDAIAFKLGEEITGGAISPNIIDNLIECVQIADDIVDFYYYLSREIYRMSKINPINLLAQDETDWISIYENIFALAEKSLLKLQQSLSTGSIPEILRLHREIEAIEETGDDIKDMGLDELFQVAPKLHFLQFYHHSELLHRCDDILDSCEDISDLIVSMVTSILK